jgi:hypothetical protein
MMVIWGSKARTEPRTTQNVGFGGTSRGNEGWGTAVDLILHQCYPPLKAPGHQPEKTYTQYVLSVMIFARKPMSCG